MGSYSVVHASGIWLASLSIVQLRMLACVGGERLWWCLHPLHVTPQHCPSSVAAHLSSTGIFPPQSPSSHPPDLSLCSQQQPSPGDCATIPKLQLPAAVPSRGSVSLSGTLFESLYGCPCMAAARTVWFSFCLGCHRSAVSLSALNVSPLTQTIAPLWGSDPCFSFPTHWEQVQSYWHSCFSP